MSERSPEAEITLPGGLGSGGLVVRIGSTVRRPMKPHSPSVHDFLRHLERVGFDGAPRLLGIDDDGREILEYIVGDVAVPPFPAWSADDGLLATVAELQRRLQAAASCYVPPPGAVWDTANLPPAGAGSIVCHNDLCIENVVVRDGKAVACIDFDFAAPADPLYDIAIAARHWVPMRDPHDLSPGQQGIDQVARFAVFADAHRLSAPARSTVVEMLGEFLDRALRSMRARAMAGQRGYVEAWRSGYEQQNRRSRAWLDAHSTSLTR